MRIPPAPILALLLTGACTPIAGEYPTLLPRPIEQTGTDEPAPAPPPLAAPDAALDGQVTTLAAASARSDAAFATDLARARSRVAAAGAVGGEAWVEAQIAVSGLDTAQGASAAALADLEALVIARADAGAPLYPALEAARAEAEARVLRQSEAVETLRAALPAL